MTKRNRILILAGLALLIVVPVVLKQAGGNDVKEVEVQTVEKRVITPTILASGNLTYQTEIRMISEVMGRVKSLHVKEGDSVQQGDLLVQLDPATVQAPRRTCRPRQVLFAPKLSLLAGFISSSDLLHRISTSAGLSRHLANRRSSRKKEGKPNLCGTPVRRYLLTSDTRRRAEMTTGRRGRGCRWGDGGAIEPVRSAHGQNGERAIGQGAGAAEGDDVRRCRCPHGRSPGSRR